MFSYYSHILKQTKGYMTYTQTEAEDDRTFTHWCLEMGTYVDEFFYALTPLSLDDAELVEKLGIGNQVQWISLYCILSSKM